MSVLTRNNDNTRKNKKNEKKKKKYKIILCLTPGAQQGFAIKQIASIMFHYPSMVITYPRHVNRNSSLSAPLRGFQTLSQPFQSIQFSNPRVPMFYFRQQRHRLSGLENILVWFECKSRSFHDALASDHRTDKH